MGNETGHYAARSGFERAYEKFNALERSITLPKNCYFVMRPEGEVLLTILIKRQRRLLPPKTLDYAVLPALNGKGQVNAALIGKIMLDMARDAKEESSGR